MLLYKYFRFCEVMDEMFLLVRGAVLVLFRATLIVVSSLFMSSYDQDGELGDVLPHTHTPRYFLDNLDFSGGSFDL